MSTATRGGLEHLGHLYDTSEDLVAAVLPRVRATLAAGARVSAIVERRTRRALLEALGPGAGIEFTTAGSLRDGSRGGLPGHVRHTASPVGGLVLAQYSAFDVPDAELRAGEEQVNRLPTDLPVTLVCACARDSREARLATVRATHPGLLDAGANPDFRAPEDRLTLPRPGDVPVLAVDVAGSGDLRGLRAEVGRVARTAGLHGDEVHRALLAVHEAAVVVGGAERPDRMACAVEVWAGDGSLAVEVRGPAPTSADGGTADRLPRHPDRRPEPLDHVRLFCPTATIEDSGDARVIRLVTR